MWQFQTLIKNPAKPAFADQVSDTHDYDGQDEIKHTNYGQADNFLPAT